MNTKALLITTIMLALSAPVSAARLGVGLSAAECNKAADISKTAAIARDAGTTLENAKEALKEAGAALPAQEFHTLAVGTLAAYKYAQATPDQIYRIFRADCALSRAINRHAKL